MPPAERPHPSDETSPARLLLDAVDALPARDRDRVLLWLLDPASTGPRAGRTLHGYTQALLARVPELSPTASEHIHEHWAGPHTANTRGERLHVVPIRLGDSQYRRLRSWCTQHNFSMATVVRGLVDQFLDGQEPDPRAAEQPRN